MPGAESKPVVLLEGEFTAFPVGDGTIAVLPPIDGDPMGRVLIRPHTGYAFYNDWTRTWDVNTGRSIEVRRANCGSGCRCAVEVRLPGGT